PGSAGRCVPKHQPGWRAIRSTQSQRPAHPVRTIRASRHRDRRSGPGPGALHREGCPLMTKLRLGIVESDKPVRLTIKVPAAVYRNLLAYADALAAATKQEPLKPDKI